MIKLLVNEPISTVTVTDQTVFGGLPSAPADTFHWPTCKSCHGPMQFLGQLRARDASGERLFLLFMCQNKPGLCDDWDANSGGNAVIVVPTDGNQLIQAPETDRATRPVRYRAAMVMVDASDYETARKMWTSETGRATREVLGQLEGSPDWIQSDETPSCDICRQNMMFTAQLEEGPDRQTAMNFGGGGCAYVFRCLTCGNSAKMLWQS